MKLITEVRISTYTVASLENTRSRSASATSSFLEARKRRKYKFFWDIHLIPLYTFCLTFLV